MILQPNYTPPAWLKQLGATLVSFLVGYAFIMKDIPHAGWFSWDAFFMGLIGSGLYHGGLAQSSPWQTPAK